MSIFAEDELIRYTQQIKLSEIGVSGQKQLNNARVLCVGLGGLGSPLLLYLAAAGIGTLGIVDGDVVELSNLQRQILYRSTHVGQQKAIAAKEQLIALNPSLRINAYCAQLSAQHVTELINQYDIIVDGSDNFYTRYLLHDTCFELEKPYVYASATQYRGYCSLFYGKQGPCLRCLFPTPPNSDLIPSCDAGVLGVVPGILGILQATEVIKWVLKLGNPLHKRLLIIDLLRMNFKEIQLAKDTHCQLCAHQRPPAPICEKQTNLKNYAITAQELSGLLQQDNTILIDVRTLNEHQTHNIGGKLLPLDELPYRLAELNQSHTIILYCQSGKRSMAAVKLLLEAGFSSVKYLINGLA